MTGILFKRLLKNGLNTLRQAQGERKSAIKSGRGSAHAELVEAWGGVFQQAVKFRTLERNERRLLVRAVVLVACVRTALYVLPFVRLKDFLARRARRHPPRQDVPATKLVWAVRAAAARVPYATCLTQALAAKYLLEQAGHCAQIHIGVAKEEERFLAHAWLECDGETVLGGEIAERYAHLMAVD